MKIGIDCRDLQTGHLTGIGRFVQNVLCSLSLSSDPPECLLYGNQFTQFDLHHWCGRHARMRTRRAHEAATWWWDRISLPRLARRDHLDVFLSPSFKAPGIRSCPIAVTIHDLLLLRMPPEISGKSAIYSRAFRSFAASFARRAALVLTVSQHSRRDIIELLDVPSEKTVVVGNCVGPAYHPVSDPVALADAAATCGIRGEYILYVGAFAPHKNIDGLLRTYARLSPDLRTRFSLVLAGGAGRWTPRITETARKLGIANQFLTPGHVPEQHLPALQAGAAAFATLSRWEGFGLPVLEAMAAGTPVLCSNRTSLPEVTQGAALLVDPDDEAACSDALTRILTDEALRTQLRDTGLARARDFTPDRFAGLILNALGAAAGTPKRPLFRRIRHNA